MTMTYEKIHRLVHQKYGKAKYRRCLFCGKNADVWAYDHKDPNEMVDKIGRLFSADVTHYIPLCGTCHGKLDYPYRTPRGDWSGPNTLRPSQVRIYPNSK